jgi:hypothetical protein
LKLNAILRRWQGSSPCTATTPFPPT